MTCKFALLTPHVFVLGQHSDPCRRSGTNNKYHMHKFSSNKYSSRQAFINHHVTENSTREQPKETNHLSLGMDKTRKSSLVHVTPACVGYGEVSDHFGSYVHSLSLHFYKRLFSGLEPMTFVTGLPFAWTKQGNSFLVMTGLPFTWTKQI
jgi:hypothetical protein